MSENVYQKDQSIGNRSIWWTRKIAEVKAKTPEQYKWLKEGFEDFPRHGVKKVKPKHAG